MTGRALRMTAVSAGDGDFVVRGGREILRCAQDDSGERRMIAVTAGECSSFILYRLQALMWPK